MKLIVLMSMQCDREAISKIFEEHGIHMFSETAITGHTISTIKKYGWWPTDREASVYSAMCFAIISKEKADAIFQALEENQKKNPSEHPVRAFQVDVERMI